MITARYHPRPAVVGDMLDAPAISPAVFSGCCCSANGLFIEKVWFCGFLKMIVENLLSGCMLYAFS
jgi:hypothetical protein